METTQKSDGSKYQLLNELAKKEAEKRKSAPLVEVSANMPIRQKQEIARIAKATGGQMAKDGYYHYFAREEDAATEAYKGSEVVLDGVTGDVVRCSSDIMYRIPTSIYQDQLDRVGRVNPARVSASLKEAKESITANQEKSTVRTYSGRTK
jgi:hypothetical protein